MLRIAEALRVDGTLRKSQLDRLLNKVDLAEFSEHDQRFIEPLLNFYPRSVDQFTNWSRLGMPYLRSRLSFCLSPDLKKQVKGTVMAPRPAASSAGDEDGRSERGKSSYDERMIVVTAAASASMLGLVAAAAGPVARYLRRRRRRYPCAFDVFVSSAAGTGDGKIVDISLIGAKIRKGSYQGAIGDRVQMSADTFHVDGYVVWCNAHFMGVRFRSPLSRQQIKRAISTKPTDTRPARSGVGAETQA